MASTKYNEWALKYHEKCSCSDENISYYFCDDEECTDKAQKLYCMHCVVEENKHNVNHKKRVTIESVI